MFSLNTSFCGHFSFQLFLDPSHEDKALSEEWQLLSEKLKKLKLQIKHAEGALAFTFVEVSMWTTKNQIQILDSFTDVRSLVQQVTQKLSSFVLALLTIETNSFLLNWLTFVAVNNLIK